MEVWKPPNYRLPDVRKGNELQAQLLLIITGSSGGNNRLTSGIPILFEALQWITGTAPHIAACVLSPHKTTKLKMAICKPKPAYRRPKQMIQG